MGKVPTISINKTDGCHVYLSKDSLACEIISAKSSEMNVLVPNKDGEYVSEDINLFMNYKHFLTAVKIFTLIFVTILFLFDVFKMYRATSVFPGTLCRV